GWVLHQPGRWPTRGTRHPETGASTAFPRRHDARELRMFLSPGRPAEPSAIHSGRNGSGKTAPPVILPSRPVRATRFPALPSTRSAESVSPPGRHEPEYDFGTTGRFVESIASER